MRKGEAEGLSKERKAESYRRRKGRELGLRKGREPKRRAVGSKRGGRPWAYRALGLLPPKQSKNSCKKENCRSRVRIYKRIELDLD
jgi:hypothetical protein